MHAKKCNFFAARPPALVSWAPYFVTEWIVTKAEFRRPRVRWPHSAGECYRPWPCFSHWPFLAYQRFPGSTY